MVQVHQNMVWKVVKDTLWIQSSKFGFLKTHISRQWGMQLGSISIKNQLDLKNLILFHIHIYYCITFILSNPCFVLLYLQLAAKLATAAEPRAILGEDSDDGTADVVEVLCNQEHVFFHSSSDELSSWGAQISSSSSSAVEDQVLLFPIYCWWSQREKWWFSEAAWQNRDPSWRPGHIPQQQGSVLTLPHVHDTTHTQVYSGRLSRWVT